MNLAEEFERSFLATAARLGVTFNTGHGVIRDYVAGRLAVLAVIVDEPGFEEALQAEGINAALVAAGEAVDAADALDKELVAFATGMLTMAARAAGLVI